MYVLLTRYAQSLDYLQPTETVVDIFTYIESIHISLMRLLSLVFFDKYQTIPRHIFCTARRIQHSHHNYYSESSSKTRVRVFLTRKLFCGDRGDTVFIFFTFYRLHFFCCFRLFRFIQPARTVIYQLVFFVPIVCLYNRLTSGWTYCFSETYT